MDHNLVDGKILYTDSTHLKANANKNKFVEDTVKVEAQEYIKELNAAINEDRAKYVTTDRNGYREYKSKNDRCANCPRREECLSEKQKNKKPSPSCVGRL